MRSGIEWLLFLFVLAVGDNPVRASGANRGLPTDDKVAVVLKPSALLFGSCPKGPASTMNVRLQTMKTKSGAIFGRKAVTYDVFTCLAALGSQPLAASSIQECSEKTKASGLKMFRWDGGQCTGYTNGIPKNFALCSGAGSVVLYSVVVEALSPVVSNITLAFLNNTIDAAWDVTPNSCFPVSYHVSFNNNDTFVSDKRAIVGLETAPPCAEYPLTVTPVDSNSVVVGSAATVKVVIPKALELFLNLTHGVTAVKASWGAEYTCNPNKQPTAGGPLKSYSVELGSQTKTTDNSKFEFTFDRAARRCTDTASIMPPALNKVTLMAFDGTGSQLGTVTATLTNTSMPGHRYESIIGDCIYYQKLEETPGGVGLTYYQLQTFCQKTMSSDPIEFRGFSTYLNDLTYWETSGPKIIVVPHFVGLKRNSTNGKWLWTSGNEVPVTDGSWDSGEPSAAGDCVKLNAQKKLAAVSCDATNMAAVCFDYLT